MENQGCLLQMTCGESFHVFNCVASVLSNLPHVPNWRQDLFSNSGHFHQSWSFPCFCSTSSGHMDSMILFYIHKSHEFLFHKKQTKTHSSPNSYSSDICVSHLVKFGSANPSPIVR